jgi:hypothetical protein
VPPVPLGPRFWVFLELLSAILVVPILVRLHVCPLVSDINSSGYLLPIVGIATVLTLVRATISCVAVFTERRNILLCGTGCTCLHWRLRRRDR